MSRSTSMSPLSRSWLVILVLSMLSCVTAYEIQAREEAYNSPLFKRLARDGQIHIDRRAPPPIPAHVLAPRSSGANSDSSSASTASATASFSASQTATKSLIYTSSPMPSGTTLSSSAVSTSSTSTETVPTALPSPFDTSLSNNFTVQSCPSFFSTFLGNATFRSCLPVSLLLQNSMSFFKASRSAKILDNVLDASCSASLAICSPLMANLASQLISDNNCGNDYRRQNPLVLQAYNGLLAYEPLYNATCLENPKTSNYCFVDALVNNTNSADMYPYFTALGVQLPKGVQPSCSDCLQRTMNVFAGYARQKDQPLAKTYVAAAIQIDGSCGPTFANADVKVAVENAKKSSATRSSIGTLTMSTIAVMISWLLLL